MIQRLTLAAAFAAAFFMPREKSLLRPAQTVLSNQFFGDSPLNKDFGAYFQKAKSIDSSVNTRGIAMQAWAASYRAAHEAKLQQQISRRQFFIKNF
ncbi:hypothetical protein JFT81_15145 [Pseudomonas sp. TH43]|uniref:hypothetical protein n=1 Tax=Pseudomonas sp. TH43 TaxID=2796407 RepID=UPI0019139E16|nr:hypothetical protein [Pseudomonas sp. TH43]MBK5375971.1 hypothetical protein [Pseudomonas sp. TH43]